MATISLSTIADFTASVGAPRVAAIEYPPGLPLGRPGDTEGRRAVLRTTLKAFHELNRPGIVHLPFEWPEPRRQAITHPKEPPPISRLLKRRPWLFLKLLKGDIPD